MRIPNAFDFDVEFELVPSAAGTTLRGAGSMTTHRLWRLLEPVLRAEVPKDEAREAARLKALIEAAR
jgi:hypothetical protein